MTDTSAKLLDKTIANDLLETDFGQKLIKKYEFNHLLSHSSTSYIYIISDKDAEKQFTLKIIKRKRYDLDIEALKGIKHPGIVDIFDMARTDKYIYLIKEYIEGLNLERYIEENGYMLEEEVIDIAKDLCHALDHLHTQDPPLIFRDLKPANIMLMTGGKIRLIDIDSLRKYKDESKKDTVFIGTEGYAAPEQFGFSQTDGRTDIYTLGTTMYYLLAGQPPSINDFKLRDIRDIRLDLSQATYNIIKKCTMFSPEGRYQDIRELRRDLEAIGKGGQKGDRIKLHRGLTRHFTVHAVAAVAITAIVASAFVVTSNRGSLADSGHQERPGNQSRFFYNLSGPVEAGLSDMGRIPLQYPKQEDISEDGAGLISPSGGRGANHLDYVVESPKVEPTEDGAIRIVYPPQAITCEYSYNYINWDEYKGPVQVTRVGYIYIRSKMPDGSYIYNNIFIDSIDPIEHHNLQIIHRIYPGFELPSDKRELTIYYPDKSVIREYSFDSVSWLPYEGSLSIRERCYVFYRAIMPNGNLIRGGADFSNFKDRSKPDS